jgi:hypothetical protein
LSPRWLPAPPSRCLDFRAQLSLTTIKVAICQEPWISNTSLFLTVTTTWGDRHYRPHCADMVTKAQRVQVPYPKSYSLHETKLGFKSKPTGHLSCTVVGFSLTLSGDGSQFPWPVLFPDFQSISDVSLFRSTYLG